MNRGRWRGESSGALDSNEAPPRTGRKKTRRLRPHARLTTGLFLQMLLVAPVSARPAAVHSRILFRSQPRTPQTTTLMDVSRRRAGWRWVSFAVRRIGPSRPWRGHTGADECCFVLLKGTCQVEYEGTTVSLGPRRDVFSAYPHALYLPPGTRFRVASKAPVELADGRAPVSARLLAALGRQGRALEPRLIRPEDCGFEIRGGGNATRQIVDVLPPAFPAARLMICEVYTPAGNWSSYPPHKHDVERPPREVRLEEIYYYRFAHPEGFGLQRLYDRHHDRTFTVRHGDVVLIRSGYHPFVTAYGYDAYYLNVLAGATRSMAASDDPRYAAWRAWPAPDLRVPLVSPPASVAGEVTRRIGHASNV
ncbi:MAG: 5-deoxy-glucuronate isomerase [Acidobacteriota bacterium]